MWCIVIRFTKHSDPNILHNSNLFLNKSNLNRDKNLLIKSRRACKRLKAKLISRHQIHDQRLSLNITIYTRLLNVNKWFQRAGELCRKQKKKMLQNDFCSTSVACLSVLNTITSLCANICLEISCKENRKLLCSMQKEKLKRSKSISHDCIYIHFETLRSCFWARRFQFSVF